MLHIFFYLQKKLKKIKSFYYRVVLSKEIYFICKKDYFSLDKIFNLSIILFNSIIISFPPSSANFNFAIFSNSLKSLSVIIFCGPRWNRTIDTGIFSPLLYQLSYGPIFVENIGLEPITFCLQSKCSTNCANSPYLFRIVRQKKYCYFSVKNILEMKKSFHFFI